MRLIFQKLADWWNSYCPEPFHRQAIEKMERDTFKRVYILCYILAVAFVGYGLSIFPYLKEYIPTLTMGENIFPRVLFNALPLILAAEILKRLHIKNWWKIEIFYILLPILVVVASNIHVWEIARSVDGSILGPVNAANSFLFTVSIAGIAPPTKTIIRACLYYSLIFWWPFLNILQENVKFSLVFLVSNDVLTCVALNLYMASHAVHQKADEICRSLRIRQESETSMGKEMTEVIWDQKDTKSRLRRGVFVDTDIRDSTEIGKLLGVEKDEFEKDYKKLVLGLIAKVNGELLNEAGDGHLSFFGPEENHDLVDLEGVAGIEEEEEYADIRLYQPFISNVNTFLNDLLDGLNIIKSKYNLPQLNIGAGVSIETEEFGVIASDSGASKKYVTSIGNSAPTVVNRLQKFSKVLRANAGKTASVVVFHPKLGKFRLLRGVVEIPTHGEVENFDSLEKVISYSRENEGSKSSQTA